jgi:hypothetical protein
MFQSYPSRSRKAFVVTCLVIIGVMISVGVAGASATTKSLSTNYTLVNLGSGQADVTVSYYKEDGSTWSASASSTSITLPTTGSQAIVAQYFDTTMSAGRGSAVVSSNQPLGAVVQILARSPQVPTQGAYTGSSVSDSTYYVPLVIRNLNGTNSQIMIQNADTGSVTVQVQLIKSSASPGANYTKSGISIAQGATFYYDLNDESSANVADGWFGSAIVTASASKKITVVSNLFAGADQLQTFPGFPSTSPGTTWFVPLFTSRLTNALSTPVTVQNLSGGTIAVGGITMSCVPDASSTGSTPFNASNTASVANNESTFFNPVIDTSLPNNWFGSCQITAPGNVVAFVQMRQPGVTASADAYAAIKGGATNTKAIIPLAAKRLANGFATVITIQNLSGSQATVNLTYVPSPNYIAGGGSSSNILVNGLTIPANGSLIRNLRLTSGAVAETALPDGWFGTLTIQSTGAPIDAFVQLTTIGATAGDTLMAHGVFTQP